MAISWKFIDSEIGSPPVDYVDSGHTPTDGATKYPAIPVGTIRKAIDTGTADDGVAEFVYLKGVASTAVGDFVAYDEAGVTERTVATSVGNVGVAMAATVADTWGWYQISGNAQATVITACADNAQLFATSTAGTADDAIVDTDVISGAVCRALRGSGTGITTVQLNRPFMSQTAGATS